MAVTPKAAYTIGKRWQQILDEEHIANPKRTALVMGIRNQEVQVQG